MKLAAKEEVCSEDRAERDHDLRAQLEDWRNRYHYKEMVPDMTDS